MRKPPPTRGKSSHHPACAGPNTISSHRRACFATIPFRMRGFLHRSICEFPGLLVWLWLSCFLSVEVRPSFGQSSASRLVDSPSATPVVTVNARCEAMVPAYCQGAYGFQVSGDGLWMAGPDPSGFSISGHLSKTESRRLRHAANQILHKLVTPSSDCERDEQIPGVGESVTVRGQQRSMKLEGAGGRLNPSCTRGDRSAA
jgi:hypothetical protein